MGLLERLKERKLFQWGIAYLCGAWVFVEATNLVVEQFSWPQIVGRVATILAFFGFFITLVLAWYHGEKGRQRVSGPELLMVAALLVVAGVALSMLGLEEEVPGPDDTVATGPFDDGRPTLAVLPFVDHSPNPEDSWFADGVQDDIDAALRRISALSVRGQSSVDRFREERPPIREMASLLGVNYLIEGSARIIGDQIRVIAHLIDGQADEEIWSETYDTLFSMPVVTGIQGTIAERVATEVGARIAPAEQAANAQPPTEDTVAYRLAHRARILWNQRTDQEIREAIDLYRQAIDRDSLYVDAYVGLASAYLMLGEYGEDESGREEAYRLAVTTAEQALELDPTLSIPHGVIAHAKAASEWDWEGADREYRAALLLEPDQSQIHCWYSLFLASAGRGEEALRELSIAQRLDPLAPWLAHGAPLVHYFARDYERSIEVGLRSIAADPDNALPYQWVCSSYLELARFDESIRVCEVYYRSDEAWPLDAKIHAYRRERDAALRALEKYGTSGTPTWGRAQVHAILGDVDEAFQWLRQAMEEDRFRVYLLPGNPVYDSLRSDPRWAEILREIGFEG